MLGFLEKIFERLLQSTTVIGSFYGVPQSPQKQTPPERKTPLLQDPARLLGKRIDAHLNQPQLAAKAGLTKQQISNLELGKRSGTVSSLGRLADALGCSIYELMAEDSELLRRAS